MIVPELDNMDLNVCIPVTTDDAVMIVKPIENNMTSSMMIKVVIERDPTCGNYNQHEFFAMMKMYQPFGTLTGTFHKCDLMLDETILNDYVFNCTCSMQYCPEVYLRMKPSCPVRVCSIGII